MRLVLELLAMVAIEAELHKLTAELDVILIATDTSGSSVAALGAERVFIEGFPKPNKAVLEVVTAGCWAPNPNKVALGLVTVGPLLPNKAVLGLLTVC